MAYLYAYLTSQHTKSSLSTLMKHDLLIGTQLCRPQITIASDEDEFFDTIQIRPISPRQQKLTFDEEYLLECSPKLITELKTLYDTMVTYYQKTPKITDFICIYRSQPWEFNDSYQMFYGTPQDFIQTIIDLYVSFEKNHSSYSLKICCSFDKDAIKLPEDLQYIIEIDYSPSVVLEIYLFSNSAYF